jgi:polar amino acid transport system substrate-binding protein
MKKLLAVLLIAPLLLAACNEQKSVHTQAINSQSVYDRVIQTGILRCGYVPWPPQFMMDPNTKQMGGAFYDVINEIAKRLNLKVEWTEETGWSTVTEAIKTGRFDMACSAFWVNSTRARHIDFSAPLYYAVANIWIRCDDTRTFTSKQDFNNEAITFSFMDGTAESKVIQTNFPNAKNLSLPELTSTAEQFEGLVAGKADAVIYDDASAEDFLKSRPGTVKKAVPQDPVAIYPTVMLLPAGETKLKAMIDNTIREIQYDGTMQKILEKGGIADLVKLPAKPYQE